MNLSNFIPDEAKAEMGKILSNKIGNAVNEYLIEFHEHFAAVKDEILFTFKRDHDLIGRVLKCHLILETYMTNCINHLNNNQLSFDEASLRFNQKIELLESKLDGMNSYFKGIRTLNTIRNKLAHNLHYAITMEDVKSMKVYVEIYKQEFIEEPVRMIEEFTLIACALLKNETVEKFAGLSKLFAVMAKQMEADTKVYTEFIESLKSKKAN